MAASYNKVVLVGNMTRNVELRRTQQGTAVCDVGLAINERRKQGDEWVDETTFVDVTLWGRTAEVADTYTAKGSSILIEGRLKLDQWEQDGQRRQKLKVVGDRLQLLGGRDQQAAGTQQAPANNYQSAVDDTPF
jgi:single-strand DNA-binding protein